MVGTRDKDNLPRGGHGGSVEIAGDAGIAIGGRGGRGGAYGFGRGGDGGGGKSDGAKLAIGGDGGDAGRYGRPALGAASALERHPEPVLMGLEGLVDRYGIFQPGKGGDSYTATVEVSGRSYSLNILLRLLQIWDSTIIDTIDELENASEQGWWDNAMQHFPVETQKAMAHMRYSEDVAPQNGLQPPDPYK